MVAYRIELSASAVKQLAALPRKDQIRIISHIDALAADPRPPGCVKLHGPESFWRIRSGNFRILYQVRDSEVLVLILRVVHRREAYRKQL